MYNSNDAFISIPIFDLYLYRDASNNEFYGLFISVGVQRVDAELIVKGEVTFNSNGFYGMYSGLNTNANLEINVENGSTSTLETCGNSRFDIYVSNDGSTATFFGDGYTCGKVASGGLGTVVGPVCQPCT